MATNTGKGSSSGSSSSWTLEHQKALEFGFAMFPGSGSGSSSSRTLLSEQEKALEVGLEMYGNSLGSSSSWTWEQALEVGLAICHESRIGSSSSWTFLQDKALEVGLGTYPRSSTQDRTENIAAHIPGNNTISEEIKQSAQEEIPLAPSPIHTRIITLALPAIVNDPLPSGGDQKEKGRRGKVWTEEEHRQFLLGLERYGRGGWKVIAQEFVKTKTASQVASHAQKHFKKLKATEDTKGRSILDNTDRKKKQPSKSLRIRADSPSKIRSISDEDDDNDEEPRMNIVDSSGQLEDHDAKKKQPYKSLRMRADPPGKVYSDRVSKKKPSTSVQVHAGPLHNYSSNNDSKEEKSGVTNPGVQLEDNVAKKKQPYKSLRMRADPPGKVYNDRVSKKKPSTSVEVHAGDKKESSNVIDPGVQLEDNVAKKKQPYKSLRMRADPPGKVYKDDVSKKKPCRSHKMRAEPPAKASEADAVAHQNPIEDESDEVTEEGDLELLVAATMEELKKIIADASMEEQEEEAVAVAIPVPVMEVGEGSGTKNMEIDDIPLALPPTCCVESGVELDVELDEDLDEELKLLIYDQIPPSLF